MADTNKIYVGGPNTQPKNIYIQNDKVKQIYKGNALLYSMSEEYTNKIKFNAYRYGYQQLDNIYLCYATEYVSIPDGNIYSVSITQDTYTYNILGQDKMDSNISYQYYIYPFDPKRYKNTSYSYIRSIDLSGLDTNKVFTYSNYIKIGELYNCNVILNGCDLSKTDISLEAYLGITDNSYCNLHARGVKFYNSNKLYNLIRSFERSNSDSLPGYRQYLSYLDIRNVRFEDEPKTLNTYQLFNGHSGITNINISSDIIKGNTNMKEMFKNCAKLTSLDVSKWDVSNVTNMNSMFWGCKNLALLDVSKWDVSKVTDMFGIFDLCNALRQLDVSKWDVSKVTDMQYMFYDCKNLTSLDVSKWDVSNVTNMAFMFRTSGLSSLDVSKWDVSNVTNMNSMFCICNKLTSLDVSKWDVSNVTNMDSMFWYCNNLNSLDVSKWNVSKVTSMSNMFRSCTALTSLDVSKWDVSNLNAGGSIFDSCTALTSFIAGHESEPDVVAFKGLKINIDLHYCTKLNYESVYALFRGVATVTSTKTITLPEAMHGKLPTDKLVIAIDKHWTVNYK